MKFLFSFPWIVPLGALILFEAIADVFSKQWSLYRGPYWWTVAISAYVVANIFWLQALKNGVGLSRGAVLFSLLSQILAVMIGLIFYKETLNGIQIMGLLLGIVSIGFLLYE